MLKIVIPDTEAFDQSTNRFVTIKGTTLSLEHSLLSVSKWEAKTHKQYFSPAEKTIAEKLEYIKCMTCTPNVDPIIYTMLTPDNLKSIVDYISDPMTATTFKKIPEGKPNRHVVTSEELYYQMASFGIPFECEKWHLNRLLTLIRICSIRNAPPKKGSKKDIAKRYSELNNLRRGGA